MGRTQDWTAWGFVTCLAHLSIILCYSDSDLSQKRLFKILFKCKSKKSDYKVHQSWLSKRWPLSMQSASDPGVLLELRTVTHFKLTVLLLQKSSIHIMNTVQKRTKCRIQWRMKPTIFLDIFQVIFTEEKRTNLKTSYLLFWREFQAISNAGLKSRTCSDRLQNFMFVQWELVLDEAVKWSDPFRDSEKNGAVECVLMPKNISRIKFGLLPRKGNRSKWHSTQIFFNT